MTCAAIAAIAGAVVAMQGGDMIVLAPDPVAAARLCYENTGAQESKHGAWAIRMGDLTVTGFTVVGGGPETVTIEAPLPYMVFPADMETVDILDGQSVTVQIILGLS